MSSKDTYYRRKLPHYHPDGYPLLITFRLAESFPRIVLRDLKEQREQEAKSAILGVLSDIYVAIGVDRN